MDKEMLEKILAGRDWCYVGLRGMYADELNGAMRPSRIWEDGNPTDDTLPGTCSVALGEWWDGLDADADVIDEAVSRASKYGDGRIGVIVGTSAQAGEDTGEVILRDAECIYLFASKN